MAHDGTLDERVASACKPVQSAPKAHWDFYQYVKLEATTLAQIEHAFSLLELTVVTATLSILVALLLPALQRAKESGKSTVCINNLKQIGQATYLYANDYNDYYPFNDFDIQNQSEGSTYATKLLPYVVADSSKFWAEHLDKKNFSLFVCPSWKKGEGNPPVFEFSRMPNRDYGANYFLGTRSAVWNVSPVRMNFRENESENWWINWFVIDGGYRRIINDLNGPCLYGSLDMPAYWNATGFQPRHMNGANVLFRDGSVKWIRTP